MSDQVAVVDKPKQILTIEPVEYVAQVFEPFAKRLVNAKENAKDATFDVTTTSGMATAVRYRAIFREIRVDSEKARKLRKAPILEIGKLLDSRQKEIEADIAPYESKFDDAIKAEEARKEAEKQAKANAERQRITKIQAVINELRITPMEHFGKSSADINAAASDLSELVLSLEFYAEFLGEAVSTRDDAVNALRDMAAKALASEQEATRLAEERAQLERDRAAQAEAERVAAAARAEQEKKEKAAGQHDQGMCSDCRTDYRCRNREG